MVPCGFPTRLTAVLLALALGLPSPAFALRVRSAGDDTPSETVLGATLRRAGGLEEGPTAVRGWQLDSHEWKQMPPEAVVVRLIPNLVARLKKVSPAMFRVWGRPRQEYLRFGTTGRPSVGPRGPGDSVIRLKRETVGGPVVVSYRSAAMLAGVSEYAVDVKPEAWKTELDQVLAAACSETAEILPAWDRTAVLWARQQARPLVMQYQIPRLFIESSGKAPKQVPSRDIALRVLQEVSSVAISDGFAARHTNGMVEYAPVEVERWFGMSVGELGPEQIQAVNEFLATAAMCDLAAIGHYPTYSEAVRVFQSGKIKTVRIATAVGLEEGSSAGVLEALAELSAAFSNLGRAEHRQVQTLIKVSREGFQALAPSAQRFVNGWIANGINPWDSPGAFQTAPFDLRRVVQTTELIAAYARIKWLTQQVQDALIALHEAPRLSDPRDGIPLVTTPALKGGQAVPPVGLRVMLPVVPSDIRRSLEASFALIERVAPALAERIQHHVAAIFIESRSGAVEPAVAPGRFGWVSVAADPNPDDPSLLAHLLVSLATQHWFEATYTPAMLTEGPDDARQQAYRQFAALAGRVATVEFEVNRLAESSPDLQRSEQAILAGLTLKLETDLAAIDVTPYGAVLRSGAVPSGAALRDDLQARLTALRARVEAFPQGGLEENGARSVGKALRAISKKDYAAGVEWLTKALKANGPTDPRNPGLYYLRGKAELDRRNATAAKTDMQRVIQLNGAGHAKNAAAYYLLGKAEEALGDYADADRDLTMAIALNETGQGSPDPRHLAMAYRARAFARLRLGRSAEAETDVRRALEGAPGDYRAARILAAALMRQGGLARLSEVREWSARALTWQQASRHRFAHASTPAGLEEPTAGQAVADDPEAVIREARRRKHDVTLQRWFQWSWAAHAADRAAARKQAIQREVLLMQAVNAWQSSELVFQPAATITTPKPLIIMFSDPETYEAIPLVIKSHMPFVVTYTGDRNDHHVRSLISKLLSAERYTSQISPTTYHTLYYPRDMDPWIQPRLTTVGWFHEGIMPSVRWYSVKATTTDWFGELRRVLGELGVVIPSEEVLEPALEATRDYFRFA